MARNDPQFNVRMPSELKHQLTAIAETNGRSINAEIIAAIQLWIKMHKEKSIPSISSRLSPSEKESMDIAIAVLSRIKSSG